MRLKIKEIFQKQFIRNIILLATGTAGAQIVTIVASPFITRLYGPESFGIMGTFAAMANIIIPIAALTYPIAIVLPKKEKEAVELINLSFFVTLFLTLFSFIILILFHKNIVNIFNLNDINSFVFLIPLVVLFAGLMQTAKQWLIRTGQFSINAKATLYQSLIINGGKVGIGLFYPVASVLVILTTFINGIRTLIMVMFANIPKLSIKRYFLYEKKSLFKLAKKYYDFPLFRAPESLLTGISHSAPILLLTALFGPASAGFYSIGRSVLSIPTQLIGEAVGDVFYPKIAEDFNNGKKITGAILKATFGLAALGIIPFGIIILFGPILFSFVFGVEWIVAGEYARWIALWSFSNFINKPSVRSLAVLNAQRYHLMYTFFGLLVRILVLLIGFYIFSSDMIAVALFGIAGAILNVGLISFTLYLSKRK